MSEPEVPPDRYAASCCDEFGQWTEGRFKTLDECNEFTRGKTIVSVGILTPIRYADIMRSLRRLREASDENP